MRVVAGEFKGRRLVAPKGLETRPTPDRVREALFSIVGDRVVGARVLDLFAGSGALGIEALSRGATYAELVDDARAACSAIERNLTSLGCAQRARVVCSDVGRHLRTRPSTGPFDLITVDAPYTMAPAVAGEVAQLLAQGGWLSEEALVVIEHGQATELGELSGLDEVSTRRYGDTAVSIFEIREG